MGRARSEITDGTFAVEIGEEVEVKLTGFDEELELLATLNA